HADALGLLADRFLSLLLGADEQHVSTAGDGALDERVASVEVCERLLQIDDVDAVALGHDESLHLRVPTTGLVPEVDAALEQLAHGHDGHGGSSSGARLSANVWRCLGHRISVVCPSTGWDPDAHAATALRMESDR